MTDILASISGGAANVEATLWGLRQVMRTAYATGRSSRAVLRAVLQLCSNSDNAPPIRLLAYEICWTIVAATDSTAYRALLACARNDMLTADHPDISMAALHTVSSMPACYAPDIMSGEDVERTMTDAMSGDSPPAVRCASVVVFSQVRLGRGCCVCELHLSPLSQCDHEQGCRNSQVRSAKAALAGFAANNPRFSYISTRSLSLCRPTRSWTPDQQSSALANPFPDFHATRPHLSSMRRHVVIHFYATRRLRHNHVRVQ